MLSANRQWTEFSATVKSILKPASKLIIDGRILKSTLKLQIILFLARIDPKTDRKIRFPTTIFETGPRNRNLNPIFKIGLKFWFRGLISEIVVGNQIFLFENRISRSISRLCGSRFNFEPRNLGIELGIRFSTTKMSNPTMKKSRSKINYNLLHVMEYSGLHRPIWQRVCTIGYLGTHQST